MESSETSSEDPSSSSFLYHLASMSSYILSPFKTQYSDQTNINITHFSPKILISPKPEAKTLFSEETKSTLMTSEYVINKEIDAETECTIDSDPEQSKKQDKKIAKFDEILNNQLGSLTIENLDEIKHICLDLVKFILPHLTNHFRNKPFEAVCAAIIVVACRNANFPITLKEVVSAACKSKDLTKLINKCIFSLKSLLASQSNDIFQVKNVNISDMCLKIGEKLECKNEIKNIALFVIDYLEKKNLIQGKHSNTVAGCALKVADILTGEDKLSFEKIAENANLNKITLKNTYREMIMIGNEIGNLIASKFQVVRCRLPNL